MPPRTWAAADDSVTNMTDVSPPRRPVIAGPAPPLYGTCVIWIPLDFMKRSISSRFALPGPGEEILPRHRLRTRSAPSLFGGNDGFATSALGTSTTCVIGMKSRVGTTPSVL